MSENSGINFWVDANNKEVNVAFAVKNGKWPKQVQKTFHCIPVMQALYEDQSKYDLYFIDHSCDEVWWGEENLTFYMHLAW